MPDEKPDGVDDKQNKPPVAASTTSTKSKLTRPTSWVILATAGGTAALLLCAAIFFPGLSSLKIELFEASVELENEQNVLDVLDKIHQDPESKKHMATWLETNGFVSLDTPEELGDPKEREEFARRAASRFGDMVPAEPVRFTGSEEDISEAIEAFKASTSKETLVGQLRRRSEGRDPPFNIVGDKVNASVPAYTGDLPRSKTIHIRRDADFAKYMVDGEVVELINPKSPAARPLIAAVRKVNMGSGTDIHLQRRQWCWLDLQSSANTVAGIGETAPLIIVPKEYGSSPDERPADIPGQVSENFLIVEPPECF